MKVLFVCWGDIDGLSHWRSYVPSRAWGADLVCIDMTGTIKFSEAQHKLGEYDVCIVQTCWYDWQHKVIEKLRLTGAKILINVDDWLRGIGRRAKLMGVTDLWQDFTKSEILDRHERILRESDGILASTPALAEKLSQFNRVGLAPNGLDLHRYSPWRDPVRDDGFIIGWAGGIGHGQVIREIAPQVRQAIEDLNSAGLKAQLCVVGQDERGAFGLPAALHLRWADKYLYPQYLSCFDLSLAPSRDDSFYRYKSQLRLYEGAALGTPTLGGPLYDEMDGYGTICGDEDWYDQIMRYATDATVPEQARKFCYEHIDRFTIEERISVWQSETRNLLSLPG